MNEPGGQLVIVACIDNLVKGAAGQAIQNFNVAFGVEGAWLTSRRIDGQFPNYKQLLPETFEL